MNRIILTILLIVAFWTSAEAQEAVFGDFFIENFSNTDYQSHVQVWSIAQDEQGLIYAATFREIVIYDGNNWEKLDNDLGTSFFRMVKQDPNNRIIIGGMNHFGFVDYHQNGSSFYNVVSSQLPDSLQNFGEIWDIIFFEESIYLIADNDVIVWNSEDEISILPAEAATYSISILDDRFFVQPFRTPLLELIDGELVETEFADVMGDIRLEHVFPYDEEYHLGISQADGLMLFNEHERFFWGGEELNRTLVENRIYRAELDSNKNIIISTLGAGVYIINKQGEIISNISTHSGLANRSAKRTFIDRDENLWVALDEGLARIEIQSPARYLLEHNNYTAGSWASVLSHGKLFVGRSDGVYGVDFTTLNEPHILSEVFITTNQIYNLNVVDDYLIISGDLDVDGHGFWIYDIKNGEVTDKRVVQSTFSYIEKNDAKTYIYTGRDNLYRYTIEHGVIVDELNYNAQGSRINAAQIVDDWIVASSFNNTLVYVHKNDTSKTPIPVPFEFEEEQQMGFDIVEISGEIYVITPKGSFHLNSDWRPGDSGHPLHDQPSFVVSLGEQTFPVRDIIQSKDGTIIGYDYGVHFDIKVDEEERNPDHTILSANPIQFVDHALGSTLRTAGKNIINNTVNRLTIIYPEKFNDQKQFPHSPLLRNVNIITNDSTIFGGGLVESDFRPVITSKENSLRFTFAAPQYHLSNRLEYRFYLEGFEDGYSEWTSDTRKDYTNLSGRDYTFKVQVKNHYGEVSEATVFHFTVLPPWYLTNLAIFLYLLILSGFVYQIVQWQVRKVKLKEQEKARIRDIEHRAETAELQAKVAETQAKVIESENARRKDELDRAKDVQDQFIPHEIPELDGYELSVYHESATEVGGDYYDFRKVKDKQYVFIGDATGHGMPAGIMVAITKSSVIATTSGSPKKILQSVNRSVKEIGIRQLHMALQVLLIEGDHVTLSSAAIPGMLHYKAQEKEINTVENFGLPLGAINKPNYEEVKIQVQKNDIILLMTDGLPESENEEKQQLDYEKIEAFVTKNAKKSVSEIRDGLVQLGTQWRGDAEQDDDVTIVVLKKL